ncbi:MAG: TonB-dependent receptor, partial [Paramuribaculum sp.]|nr:TonB-dependent receptor [Paramuribaculum sp.]
SRTTRDMLMWFSTPLSLGYSGYYSNIGDMRNTGVEVELNGDIIRTKDVTWNLSLNLSWQRNRVVSLPAETAQYSVDGHAGYLYGEYYIGEGLPLYTWYMKKFAGVSENGESLYYHTDADGNMVASTDYSNADYYLCGSALPTVFGGFSTTLNAYGFDLSATFNYSIGGKKYDSAYQNLMTPPHDAVTGHAVHQDLFKGWTAEAPNPEIPRWQYNDLYTSNFCDRFLTDASYLSLKNITLGYTLPKNLTRRFYVDNLRVYFTCENVYYWSHRKGFDPRVDMGYGSYGGIPPMRSFTGGLQIRF